MINKTKNKPWNRDHLSIKTIICISLWWPSFTGLTVFNYHIHHIIVTEKKYTYPSILFRWGYNSFSEEQTVILVEFCIPGRVFPCLVLEKLDKTICQYTVQFSVISIQRMHNMFWQMSGKILIPFLTARVGDLKLSPMPGLLVSFCQ